MSLTPELEEHWHGPGLGGGRATSSSALKQGQEKGLITRVLPHTPSPSRLSHGLLLLCPAGLTATALPAAFLSPAAGAMAADPQAQWQKGTEGVSVFGDWKRPGLTRS